MNDLYTRLQNTIDGSGLSTEEWLRALKTSRGTFNNYVSGRRKPSFEFLADISSIAGVSLDFLIKGSGAEFVEKQSVNFDDGDFVKIDVYDIALAAGEGRTGGKEVTVDQLAFRTQWLSRNGIDPTQTSIVRVEGKSMEPALQNGSIVLIDHRHQTPLLRSHIYAVRDGDSLLVKRVERSAEDQSLMLMSDNPEYPTKHYVAGALQDFAIIGRVVWSARTWPA